MWEIESRKGAWGVGEGLTFGEESEQRLEGGEGISQVDTREKSIQAEGTAKAKALGWICLECSQNSREVGMPAVQGGREGRRRGRRWSWDAQAEGTEWHGGDPMSASPQVGMFTPPCLCTACSLHLGVCSLLVPLLAWLATCPSSIQL